VGKKAPFRDPKRLVSSQRGGIFTQRLDCNLAGRFGPRINVRPIAVDMVQGIIQIIEPANIPQPGDEAGRLRNVVRRVVPLVAGMGYAEGNDLGFRKIVRVADNKGGCLEKFTLAVQRGHDFLLGRRMTVRDVSIEAHSIKFVANFKGINREIGSP
jgi:hypothetical protein